MVSDRAAFGALLTLCFMEEPPMQPLGSPYWGHRSITSQVEMEEEEDEAEAMDTAGWTCSLVDAFSLFVFG